MSIKEEKAALRKRCAVLRDGIDAESKRRMDERICAAVASLAVFRFAQAVLLYHPIRSEVNVLPLLDAALAQGKEVYLPLCDKEVSGKMTFRRVGDRSELVPGAFGVMEPREDAAQFVCDDKRTLCVIPALAFSRDGYRLGYGKGYYDRFLGGYSGSTVGVQYSDLLLPQVPRNRFDLQVDLVVTEKGVRMTREI